MTGKVVYIHLAETSGASLRAVDKVTAVAGYGLNGDRHSVNIDQDPLPDWRQLTLIAEEDLLSFCEEYKLAYFPGCSRRQISTRGAALKSLIGKTFRIGEAVCYGVEECHPCRHLANQWSAAILPGLVGRSGIRAGILQSGVIKTGGDISVITEISPSEAWLTV